jgi:hypothetical protein
LAVSFYTTGFGAQQNTSAHHGVATQIFRLQISANAGNLILATANEELTTNESTSNAFVWVELFVSDSPSATTGAANSTEICGLSGTNITPDQHHFVFDRTGALLTPYSGTQYVIYAVTWDPDLSLDGTIELNNYGKLDAIVFS